MTSTFAHWKCHFEAVESLNSKRPGCDSVADFMLRYRHSVGTGRLRGTLSYQVNISNLFNQDGRLPQRFSTIPPYDIPGGRGVAYSRFDLLEPRSIRLTTTFSY